MAVYVGIRVDAYYWGLLKVLSRRWSGMTAAERVALVERARSLKQLRVIKHPERQMLLPSNCSPGAVRQFAELAEAWQYLTDADRSAIWGQLASEPAPVA